MVARLLHLRRAEDRRFLREWLILVIACVLFVTLLASFRWTGALDKLTYDWWLQRLPHTADPDILLVEIDNESLEDLGRWPWPREDHAAVLRRIAAAGPRCVIYDILFSEPSPADPVLAQAISLAPVYLPLAIVSASSGDHFGEPILPVEELRDAAAGIGHINLEADNDGVVRSIALFEGNSQHMWPQLTLPAYRMLQGRSVAPNSGGANSIETFTSATGASLTRSRRLLIPFSLLAHPYPRVSFSDVLRGRVPPEVFHDRIVLVGATADGLGEHLTTTISGQNGAMPGIAVHASC
ncbi:CHASE2 domain-containing protein [Burkholderia sp. Bp9143]|uniref:CHASE2 domain-containing protein n=1 Tax=Burkholderia sp. Bp9143 TaxID=2184574 RepID=UPI0016280D6D|nr:CHASE2 domain-containing protein [Burkholderia sp. Bp9143]